MDTISVMNKLDMLLADFSSYEVPDVMSVEELVAVDEALPTGGKVEEAEEKKSFADDSIEPKLMTLREARERVLFNLQHLCNIWNTQNFISVVYTRCILYI